MKKRSVDELIQLSDQMFASRGNLLNLWQTIADHFYPERADFTVTRDVGDEISDQLLDSSPVIYRRDLGNAYAAILRDGRWFDMDVDDVEDGKEWLQEKTDVLYRLFGNRLSGYTRAMKESDQDFATFGQSAISIELNRDADGLLFRCWHLRDMAWFDDATGQVGGVSRKWLAKYHELVDTFGDACGEKITEGNSKTPFSTTDVRHLVIPVSMLGDEKYEKFKYVSIFLDVAGKSILECVGLNHKYYAIPRFQTIAGSPYAFSPATMGALPSARMLQTMAFTLLEAGERVARPPLIAKSNVISGGAIDLSANGITFVDSEYDERLGDSLRVLQTNGGGLPFGLEMRDRVASLIANAFYLNKLSMPETGNEMTAYEVQERMKQYRREALPLFAPAEDDYSGQVCEIAFDVAMAGGLFGSAMDIPPSLRGQEIVFRFRSPLTASSEERKAIQLRQLLQSLSEVMPFDDQAVDNVDLDEALRESLVGLGIPEGWMLTVDNVAKKRRAEASAQMMTQMGVTDGQQ